MTRLEEIEAELEQLRVKLVKAEDADTSAGGDLRERMSALNHERDSLPIPVPRTP